MNKQTEKRIKDKINPIIGHLNAIVWVQATENELKDSHISTDELIKITNKFLAVFKEEEKLINESWRKSLKNPEWMKIFLKKHYPELLGVK